MTGPTHIPYKDTTGQLIEQLLDQAEALERDYDDEAYSDQPEDGRPRPAVPAAWAIRSRPFMRWSSAAFTIMRSVCGSDEHPFCRQWVTYVHSPVVDAVRRGSGILEAFLLAWKLDSLWPEVEVVKEAAHE